jgi:hypothetical protein
MNAFEYQQFSDGQHFSALNGMTQGKIRQSLEKSIDTGLLDAPLNTYRVSTVRYKPRRKLVIGMTSDNSLRPISIRFFPSHSLPGRLERANAISPGHVFLLSEPSALAWVFPGERKLDLGLLADYGQLKSLLREYRNQVLHSITMMHFVPEHTYTARLCVSDVGARRRYHIFLKIYYDDKGARTDFLMRNISNQIDQHAIEIPSHSCYLPEHKLMLQAGLERGRQRVLSESSAASALAQFHSLQIPNCDYGVTQSISDVYRNTRAMLEIKYPDHIARYASAGQRIFSILDESTDSPQVLLHGDAHPGNLFPLANGRSGLIDLDAVHPGAPEDDLANYYAFLLWRDVMLRNSPIEHLAGFRQYISAYNKTSGYKVSLRRSLAMLAFKLLAQRVGRAICRAKSSRGNLLRLIEGAEACTTQAEQSND